MPMKNKRKKIRKLKIVPQKYLTGKNFEKYERDFVKQSLKYNLQLWVDDDGCPVLFPNKSKQRKRVKLAPFAKNKFCIIITAENTQQKKRLKNKIGIPIKKMNFHVMSPEEMIVILPLNFLEKVTKNLDVGKKEDESTSRMT